jgi:hypothetical protein
VYDLAKNGKENNTRYAKQNLTLSGKRLKIVAEMDKKAVAS